MCDVSSLLEEADNFEPARAGGLPIFRWDSAEYAMFYAPGCLCVVGLSDAAWFEACIAELASPHHRQKPEIALMAESRVPPKQGRGLDWAAELWRRAELAIAEARRLQEERFAPECLTLYMNNECNLDCVYCHTDPSPGPAPRLELEAIAAAAELVAETCRQKGHLFYGVFHGGGEPTLHRERVEQALAMLDAVASAHGVELFRYVATNGVMSGQKAIWLARHFDLIGLSCDGPAEIQNLQRPRRDGTQGQGATLPAVERTGHILCEEGCRLHVRTTITSATLHLQAEIADYICRQFSPEEIHFEPVYVGGRTSPATGLDARHAGDFVTHFLQAREVARQRGIYLMCSGSRLDTIHGPYCNVFRRTLNLVPGGGATACFEVTDATQAARNGVKIGALNETGRFEIDHSRVQELRQQLGVIPAECADCFNRYHCVRECPDRCPLDGDARSANTMEPGFRCRAHKALAYATLHETAQNLWSERVLEKDTHGKVYGTAILRPVLPVSPARD